MKRDICQGVFYQTVCFVNWIKDQGFRRSQALRWYAHGTRIQRQYARRSPVHRSCLQIEHQHNSS